MYKLPIAAIAAGLLGLAAGQGMAAPSSADQEFATKAAQGGLAEVQVGQLAQEKAQSQEVKQFGKTLVDDHMQANQELQQIAKQENITIPTVPGSEGAAEGQKLLNLSGDEFDKTFVQDEVEDHKKDIAEFQREAQSGENPALKAFAEKTIPVLEKHLKMAEALSKPQ